MEQTTETVRTTPQTPPESRPHPASPSPLPSSERDLRWRRASRSPRFRRLLILILIVLLVVGFFLWRYFTSYESTDDAQIDGHLNAISARISGHVEKLLVDDNQYVNAGTPLVQIDPRDYQVAVDRAKADYADALAVAQAAQVNVPITSVSTGSQLSTAQADVENARAGISVARQQFDAARAQLLQAEANNVKAQNDLVRYKQLVDKEEVSQQQYDQALAAAKASAAAVEAARASAAAAEQQITQAQSKLAQAEANLRSASTAPQQVAAIRSRAQSALAQVQFKKAALEQAELNLQYTSVVAPVNGVVTNRTVEVGQNVQPGQELMRIINLDDIWVTANFKETQLRQMQVGQPVTIAVDSNGKKYNGHVQSIAGASGSITSLLPPENATGNNVKVVQRIPVKITFDPGETKEHALRPGMSVEPKLAMLIFFHVLQGAGGGGLQPSEQAILADTFPPAKRGIAFAVYGIAVVMAPAIGPTLGGWITDNYTWRWIFFVNIPVGIISLLLTSRLIQDPPHLRRRKLSEMKIDYVGLGFVALGLGTLQIILDKGQRDDWFESHFILALSIISAASLLFVIWWEWRQKDPVIDLHLFRERTFAAANFLMFMLGFALLGSTLLLPLFMQTLLGYTAQQAGMALSPGGFTIMVLMPIVGFMLTRYDARRLMVFGLAVLSFSLFHMTGFDLGVDFRTVVLARMIQSVGMAFLFVPINTAAYSFLPREKNNAASGLMNLARNIGGSVGISLVTTMLARRAQHHQANLAAHLSGSNPTFQAMLQNTARMLESRGFSPVDAMHRAYGLVQSNLLRQANMLAYIDDFWLLGAAILGMIPLVFLMKRARPGGEVAVH